VTDVVKRKYHAVLRCVCTSYIFIFIARYLNVIIPGKMWQKSVTCSSVVGKMFCIQVMYDSTCNAKRVLTIVILFVYPSVPPSVTTRYRERDFGFLPFDSMKSLVFVRKFCDAG